MDSKDPFFLDEDADPPDADMPGAESSDAEVLGAESSDAEVPTEEEPTTGSKEAYLESTVHS